MMFLIVQGGESARLSGTPPVLALFTCQGLPDRDPDEPVTFWKVVTRALQVTFGFHAVTDDARAGGTGVAKSKLTIPRKRITVRNKAPCFTLRAFKPGGS